MKFEGFVAIQHQGRLAIYNRGGVYHELKESDRIEVDTGEHWIKMEVKRDYEGYYLESNRIAFYPKIVYVKAAV